MDDIEDRKRRAERGWIAEPHPMPANSYQPGQATKWYLMMGARRLLEEKAARERVSAQDLAAKRAGLREREPSIHRGTGFLRVGGHPGRAHQRSAENARSRDGKDWEDNESADN